MESLRMSTSERRRLELLSRVKDKLITLQKAADLFGLSYRHVRRIFKRYREGGDKGLIHKSRGRPSNRLIDKDIRKSCVEVVCSEI